MITYKQSEDTIRDALLAKALDRKFAGKSGWHFSIKQTLFRTNEVVMNNILKRKKVN